MAGTGYNVSSAFSQISGASWDVIRSRYADPYLDVASRQLPKDLKTFWNLCLYYSITHPVISPLIQKKSTYVVTTPIYETKDSQTREKYTDLFEHVLHIRPFLASFNFDYNTFGNAFCSVLYPFKKLLKCKMCGKDTPADQVDYILEALDFKMKCPKCGHNGTAEAHDVFFRSARDIRLIRWNPQFIEVEENPITGECTYFLRPPVVLENALRTTRRNIVNGTPQTIIDTIRQKRVLRFKKDHFFAAKRPGPSNQLYRGYGIPTIFPAMKDAFVMQIMRKAQEAICFEYLVPVRIAFPTDGLNLARMASLSEFQQYLAEQLREWRRDQNRILVFPTPVTLEEVGGRGRAILLNPEIRQSAEMICGACGLPTEFLYGGVSYSGSNVSLRIVENDFLFNFNSNVELLKFIADRVAWFMDWPYVNVSQKPFKMADDLPRAAFDASLMAQNKLSAATVLQSRDYDPDSEIEQVKKEQFLYGEISMAQAQIQARAQGSAQLISAQYQVALQKITGQLAPAPAPGMEGAVGPDGQPLPPGAPGVPQEGAQPEEPGVPGDQAIASVSSPLFSGVMGLVPNDVAQHFHSKLMNLPRDQQMRGLAQLQQQAPGIASLVANMLAADGVSNGAMRPLPEKLPPRRNPENSVI